MARTGFYRKPVDGVIVHLFSLIIYRGTHLLLFWPVCIYVRTYVRKRRQYLLLLFFLFLSCFCRTASGCGCCSRRNRAMSAEFFSRNQSATCIQTTQEVVQRATYINDLRRSRERGGMYVPKNVILEDWCVPFPTFSNRTHTSKAHTMI